MYLSPRILSHRKYVRNLNLEDKLISIPNKIRLKLVLRTRWNLRSVMDVKIPWNASVYNISQHCTQRTNIQTVRSKIRLPEDQSERFSMRISPNEMNNFNLRSADCANCIVTCMQNHLGPLIYLKVIYWRSQVYIGRNRGVDSSR